MSLALMKDIRMQDELNFIEDKLYSISETAVMLGVGETTLFSYMKSNKIEFLKINGNTKFTREAMFDYLRKTSSKNTTDKDLTLFIKANLEEANMDKKKK